MIQKKGSNLAITFCIIVRRHTTWDIEAIPLYKGDNCPCLHTKKVQEYVKLQKK